MTDIEREGPPAVEALRARVRELEGAGTGFAIVGYAVRFPGSPDADQFWEVLRQGRDAISEVPEDRWDVDDFYDPDPGAAGKMVTRRAAFIDDVAGFDASFFGVSTREAVFMDPQHRLLLETAWRAIEHSGTAPSALAGTKTGVFMGLSTQDYLCLLTNGDEPRSHRALPGDRYVARRRERAGSATGWGCWGPRSRSTPRAARLWWRSTRRARRCDSGSVTSRWPAA